MNKNLEGFRNNYIPRVEASSQTMYGTQIPLFVQTQEGQHYMISNDQLTPEDGTLDNFININLKNEKNKIGITDKNGFGYFPPRRRRRGTVKKLKNKLN